MVGASIALGVSRSFSQAVVQGSGTAMRITARECAIELEASPVFRKNVHGYVNTLLGDSMRAVACNTFHDLGSRLARWLLVAQDQMQSDRLELTQEFLAQMLGVRREGINEAAGTLLRRGVISYSRGRIVVLDTARLAKSACDCTRS